MNKIIQIENINVSELEQRLINGIVNKLLPQIQPSNDSNKERYLSRKEAAQILGVSLPTLDDLSNNGKLKFSRLGRIKRYKYSDLIDAMNNLSNKSKKLK